MYNKQSPYSISVKKGDEIYICQCAKSLNTPLCDGRHKRVDGLRPLVHTAKKDGKLHVCGCKNSSNMPWCDGSHNQ